VSNDHAGPAGHSRPHDTSAIAGRAIVLTAVGLAALIAGAALTSSQNTGASLAMALATAALVGYLAAVYSLG
jgi:hypothetical protein